MRALLGLLACLAGAVCAQPLPGRGSVEDLLAIARQQSPEVVALRLEAEAAQERAAASGALPDPLLRAELRNFTNIGSDANPNLLPARVGSTKYTLIQPLPFWGKRDARRAVAGAEAEAAQGRAGAAWNELAARIKVAHARNRAYTQQIGLLREVAELFDRLEVLSRNRYAGGLAPQQDAIRARVERTALKAELVGVENEQHHLRARLNGMLGRPAHWPVADPPAQRPLPADAALDWKALSARLAAGNAQLGVEDALLRAAERGRDSAYLNRYPDFAVGLSPIQHRQSISEWELMFEVSIPLQQESRRSQEREADRLVGAARARRETALNQIQAELAEALDALEGARRLERLFRDELLPQAELTFQAALAGYENGRVDFATLLEAQRQIRKARQDILKAEAEQRVQLAAIERLIGEDL